MESVQRILRALIGLLFATVLLRIVVGPGSVNLTGFPVWAPRLEISVTSLAALLVAQAVLMLWMGKPIPHRAAIARTLNVLAFSVAAAIVFRIAFGRISFSIAGRHFAFYRLDRAFYFLVALVVGGTVVSRRPEEHASGGPGSRSAFNPTRSAGILLVVAACAIAITGTAGLLNRLAWHRPGLVSAFARSEEDIQKEMLAREGLLQAVQQTARLIPPEAGILLETSRRPYMLNYYLYPLRLYMSPADQLRVECSTVDFERWGPGPFARRAPPPAETERNTAGEDIQWRLRLSQKEGDKQACHIEQIEPSSSQNTPGVEAEPTPAGPAALAVRFLLGLLSLAATLTMGAATYRLLLPGRPRSAAEQLGMLGASFGLGTALVLVLALCLHLVMGRFSFWAPFLPALPAAAWLFFTRQSGFGRNERPPSPGHFTMEGLDRALIALIVSILLAGTLAGIARPLQGIDSRAIYATTAKILYHEGSLDSEATQDPWRVRYHRNYPVLVPYLEALMFKAAGAPVERAAVLVFPPFLFALTLLFFSIVRPRTGRTPALILTWALVSPAFLLLDPDGGAVSGYADLPFAFWWTGGTAFLCLYLSKMRIGHVVIGALFLSGGIMTKNEGMFHCFPLSILFAIACSRPPPLSSSTATPGFLKRMLAPALFLVFLVAFSLPWMVLRNRLPATVLDEQYGAGLIALGPRGMLTQVGTALGSIAEAGFRDHIRNWHLVWIPCIALAAFAWRLRERNVTWFFAAAAAAQLTGYVLVYAVSPHEPRWHVAVSWNRLLIHVYPLVLLTCATIVPGLLCFLFPPGPTPGPRSLPR